MDGMTSRNYTREEESDIDNIDVERFQNQVVDEIRLLCDDTNPLNSFQKSADS